MKVNFIEQKFWLHQYLAFESKSGESGSKNPFIFQKGFVPGAGIEPAQHCYHWCLRPARLPIPPSGPEKTGLRK